MADGPGSAAVVVRLPPALLRLFPDVPRRVEVPAGTVAEAIRGLDERWPGLRDRLCDSRPRLRRGINIFVNGERASLDTRLEPGTEVIVMTAVLGG